MPIVLYTDGGARGNPGPAGAGAVAYEGGKKLFELKKFLGERQTNNWAEYEALALALEETSKRGLSGRELEVRMDSELVVKQILGEYKVKEPTLRTQFTKVRNLLAAHFPSHRFIHVRRDENAEADALANEAMDSVK